VTFHVLQINIDITAGACAYRLNKIKINIWYFMLEFTPICNQGKLAVKIQ